MITTEQDIRIFDDTGKGETYEVSNILHENEDEIIAKMEIANSGPFSIIIDKTTCMVTSNKLDHYIAENYVSNIRQYIKNGGRLFNVTKIDTIRDGGTISIQTSKDEYFVHMHESSIHTSYPPSEDNIIKDEYLIEFIFDRVDDHIKQMADRIERIKGIFIKMKLYETLKNLPF